MQIGDRVRDKGTKFIGTIVQLDPPTGVATRARFQADDVKGGKPNQDRKVGDPPPESMWQQLTELELVNRAGEPITGHATATTDTKGRRVNAQGALIDDAGNLIDENGNLVDVRAQAGTTAAAKSA